MDRVNLVIVIAGIVGLVVAGYGFVTLTIDAWRRRQYLDIALAVAIAITVVVLLIAYGDRLLQ
jgi:energy-converting hydrogenase Eha subunit C